MNGSHKLPDGTCCHCGPANLYKGPKWACGHAPKNESDELHAALVSAKAFGINSVPHIKAQDALYSFDAKASCEGSRCAAARDNRFQLGMVGQ